jgi:hypothetical protein
MGNLNPGATHVYERVDNCIYSREFGKNERRLVGYTTGLLPEIERYRSEINSVLRMCETDPAMRELLDQLFVLYNLKKNS